MVEAALASAPARYAAEANCRFESNATTRQIPRYISPQVKTEGERGRHMITALERFRKTHERKMNLIGTTGKLPNRTHRSMQHYRVARSDA